MCQKYWLVMQNKASPKKDITSSLLFTLCSLMFAPTWTTQILHGEAHISQTWKKFMKSRNIQYALYIIRQNSKLWGTFSEKRRYLTFINLIYWIMLCLCTEFKLKLLPRGFIHASKDHLVLILLIFQDLITRYLPAT